MEAGVRIDGDTTGVPGGHCPSSLDAGLAARTAFRWGCGAGCGGLSQESRMGRELSALNLGGRRTAFSVGWWLPPPRCSSAVGGFALPE